MNDETALRIVDLLEQMNEKLDKLGSLEAVHEKLEAIDGKLYDLQLEICGFEHEGKQFSGLGDRVTSAIAGVQDELDTLRSALPVFPGKGDSAPK